MKKTIALIIAATVWIAGCAPRDEDPASQTAANSLALGAAQAQAATVRVFSDIPSLLTGGSDVAQITAVVSDDDYLPLEGFDVSFSSDGGALQNVQAVTDENGKATVELALTGDYRNRNITVTAGVGGEADQVMVVAAGSNITLEAPETIYTGETTDVTLTLLSGSGSPIPNESISFSSEVGNTFSQNSAITDALGKVYVSLSTAVGTDNINATALDGTVFSVSPLIVVDEVDPVEAVDIPVRVRVISNESTIKTGGADIALITTLVTDESNRVLSGREVIFSSTGGVLQNFSTITNEAGQATVELSLAGDYRNQGITVRADVGEQSGEVLINAEGSELSVSGPSALVSGDIAELEITLTDGNDEPIGNQTLQVVSDSGNYIQPDSVVTTSNGKVTISVGSENGTDQIFVTALDGTVTSSHTLQVAADVLTVVEQIIPFDEFPVDAFSPFSVRWTSNGLPVAAQLMRFSTTAGVVRGAGTGAAGSNSVDVYTDADGVALVEVSSTSAGPSTVTYSDSLDSDPASQFEIEFVATVPSKVVVAATPASVATGKSSTISAKVTDVYGNPVKDAEVEFSSANDLRGGSLSPVSAVTDKDGQASITFNAGNLPTEINAVAIVGTLVDHPAITPAQVNLTITERQLNVVVGLSGLLSELDTDTRYSRTGVIQVTDGAGRPVSDASIQITLTPTVYRYGSMKIEDIDNDGEMDRWVLDPTTICIAEDVNGNRILDAGEDSNGNGLLDPSDPALVDADSVNSPTVISNQITTGSSGTGYFTIVYPQGNAKYFDVEIMARVEALGTESVATYDSQLVMTASDAYNLEGTPPNMVSPYGLGPAPAQPGCFDVPDD